MSQEVDMALKPGDNPRHVLPRHAERGQVIITYTLKQVAEAANVNYQTVRKAVSTKLLNPDDLRSVAHYVTRALARKSKPVGGELSAMMDKKHAARWKNRWPLFELYNCAAPGCSQLMFFPGACAEHGGDKRPPVKFDADQHIVILVGKNYIPLHRLIAQTPKGEQTHHRDGNPWNNRFSNLESLQPDEHQDRHLGGVLSAEVLPKQPPRKPLRSEVGSMSKAQLQKLLDEAFIKGRDSKK